MLSQIVSRRAVRTTWIAWAMFLAAACAVLVRQGERRPANNAYARGASRWLAGEFLYDQGGSGFIYLPQSAILHVPFLIFPKPLQHILWRTLTIGLFAAGVYRLCRLAEEGRGVEFFPLVSMLVLPKSWTCAINGQATPAMAGLSMLALGEIYQRRWWRAAGYLIAALTFKPLAIVLVLLVAALYRPMRGRVALGLAAFALAPFLTQNAGYVVEQYRGIAGMLDRAVYLGLAPEWAQLISLASLVGIDFSPDWQMAIRAAGAAATLGLCLRSCRTADAGRGVGYRGFGPHAQSRKPIVPGSRTLIYVYALATCYLLLFNPRTENNSYMILSPVLGVFGIKALLFERRPMRAGLLLGAAIAIVAGHKLCQLVTPHAGFVWLCPLVCLLFAVDLVCESRRNAGAAETDQTKLLSNGLPVRTDPPHPGAISSNVIFSSTESRN